MLGDSLESYHNNLLSKILGFKPSSDDTRQDFCVRRNSALSKLKLEVGLDIRRRLCFKVATWIEHVRRHELTPSAILLDAQRDEWLRERRRETGSFGALRSEDRGATATRLGPGFPLRFAVGWLEELENQPEGFSNPRRESRISKENAERLHALFLLQSVLVSAWPIVLLLVIVSAF